MFLSVQHHVMFIRLTYVGGCSNDEQTLFFNEDKPTDVLQQLPVIMHVRQEKHKFLFRYTDD
jgi:hypothetical protein